MAAVEIDVLLEGNQAVTEARKVDTAVDQIGKRAGSASQVAGQAFAGYDKALQGTSASAKTASDALTPLLTRQQQVATESAKLTQGINLLQRVLERTPAAASTINPLLEQMVVQKNALSQESKKLGSQIGDTNERMGKNRRRVRASARANDNTYYADQQCRNCLARYGLYCTSRH